MRLFGILLIVVGLVSFIWGGITYTRQEKVLDIGPLEASVNEKERIPMPPIVGGVALAAGVALLVMQRRSNA